MPFSHHAALCCPLDRLPLEEVGRSLRCTNGHSFDLAKQGYVNLLNAQDKRSKDPGDSREMIEARHRFLGAGYYQPIADQVSELLRDHLNQRSARPHLAKDAVQNLGDLIVDAGCGEGFYLDSLRRDLQSSGFSNQAYAGFDVSKWAMQVAAKRFKGSWLVASNRNIPLADDSATAVLDMFGFSDFAEFARIIQPGGALIVVGSGPEHLRELREIVYERAKTPTSAAPNTRPDGFTLRGVSLCQYTTSALHQTVLQDLLMMTPHFFRASADGKRRLEAVEALSVTVDVRLKVLERELIERASIEQ